MAISLTVEDGSNVANANSYVDLTEYAAYAERYGVTLNANAEVQKVQLIKGTDYIESKRAEFQGLPTNLDQWLQFPRTGVYINDQELASNFIPRDLKYAQMQLALAVNNGVDLMPNSQQLEALIVEEKVGPLQTKYAQPTNGQMIPTLTAADSLLEQFLKLQSGGLLTTVRG